MIGYYFISETKHEYSTVGKEQNHNIKNFILLTTSVTTGYSRDKYSQIHNLQGATAHSAATSRTTGGKPFLLPISVTGFFYVCTFFMRQ